MNRTKKKFFVAFIDYLLLIISICIVLLGKYGVENFWKEFSLHIRPFSLLSIIWIIVFYIFELYEVTGDVLLKKYVYAMFVNGAISVSVFYTVSGLGITPKTNLLLYLVIFTILFVLWRSFVARRFGRFFGRINTVIIGIDDHSLEIAREMVFNKNMGYNIIGVMKGKEANLPQWVNDKQVHMYGTIEELTEDIIKKNINVVVVNDLWFSRIFTDLYSLIHHRVSFYRLSSFIEEIDRRIPIYLANEAWFLDNLKNVERSFYEKIKRITDIILMLLIAPIFFTLFIFVALAIKINTPGPVFFKQVRVGKNGKHFVIYKFRTMVQDAERNGAQWAVKNDARITGVGRFLRLTRIDELPQIINVILGSMSFIGPRPERPEFVDELEKTIPHYKLRHLVRPGLSGWAQVKYEYAATKEETAKKLEYDLYYIKNRSIILDGKIFLKTIMTIISRRGQ